MQFAISDGSFKEDPTAGIKNMSGKTEGFRTWNEDDIAAFEARHPLGTRERLALGAAALHCPATWRLSSGWAVSTSATVPLRSPNRRPGTKLAVPIHPDLQAALAAMPSNHLTFLTTAFGKPFVGGRLHQLV